MEMPNLKRPQIEILEGWPQVSGRRDKYSRVMEHPHIAPQTPPSGGQVSIPEICNNCIFGVATPTLMACQPWQEGA